MLALATLTSGCGGDESASTTPFTSFTLRGTVLADDDRDTEPLPDDSALAVIWDLVDPDVVGFGLKLGPWVPLSGTPPIDFELEIDAAPARELLIQLADRNAIAVACLYLTRAPEGGLSDTLLVFGAAQLQLLVYVERPVTPSSPAAAFLHGTTSAGYHVADVESPELPEGCTSIETADQRGFVRYSGTCPRDTLTVAPDDLLAPIEASFRGFKRMLYENLETAW
jgi:hypothetical protein